MMYDYIIVGAGSAGCVLAERLSADGRTKVLVLEAGPRDRSWWIHVPLGYGRLFTMPEVNWMYQSEPEPELGGRAVFTPRGKVLGGSSSINGLVYMRGQHEDFDEWARLGNPGWDFASLLPYFKRSEDHFGGASALHGAGGPLCVSPLERHEMVEAFIAAAGEAGIARNDDFNGARQEGAGYYQATSRRGRRSSCAVEFLRPAERRANVTVRTEAHARRVTFDGARATGVEYEQGGARHTATVTREVILSAGAFNSPQLLQLSGIGPRALLEAHGIPLLLDAPGVGAGLQDHFYVRTTWRAAKAVTFNDAMRAPLGRLGVGLRYLLTRKGPLTISAGYGGAFFRTRPEIATPDVQIYFINFSFDRAGGPLHPFSGFMLSMSPLRPRSRGDVRIRSADPKAPPAIRYNYMTDADDRCTVIDGLKMVRRIGQAAAFRPYVESELTPGANVRTDDELLGFAREAGGTVFHPTSTCRMGVDALAVVDPKLRVRGIAGLRVADASIMPNVVSGNTNAAVIAIAEKAADLIKENV